MNLIAANSKVFSTLEQVLCAIGTDTEYTAMCTINGSWQFDPELKCENELKMCYISDFKKFGVYHLNEIFLTIVKPGTELEVTCIGGDSVTTYMAKCNDDGSWTFDPELKCKDTPVGCKYEDFKKYGVQLKSKPKDSYAKPGDKVQVRVENHLPYVSVSTKKHFFKI